MNEYIALALDYSNFFISFTTSVLFQRLTIKFNFFLFLLLFFRFSISGMLYTEFPWLFL